MPYLVDTNVLLRSVDLSHPMNPDAANAIRTLRDRSEQFQIVPQNLIEFWNVYTLPNPGRGILACIHAKILQKTLSLIWIETLETY